MQEKNINPIDLLPQNTSPMLKLYFEFNHLKQLFRQGWLKRGVPHKVCESVAEHSFGVALLSLLLADNVQEGLDVGKLLKLALVHDLGEIYAGDITPGDNINSHEKSKIEKQSVSDLFSKLPNGIDYVDLWEEYEYSKSPEAIFVKEVDRLEMGLQASVYEHQGHANLQEFFTSVENKLSHPMLRTLFREAINIRPDLSA